MTVNVLLTTGKWFEVADANEAYTNFGSLMVVRSFEEIDTGLGFPPVEGQRHETVVREFGPGSWVTWDVED